MILQSYREGLQLLCQAYDSDPRNPAVLNLLAHYCLTRKEYSKVMTCHLVALVMVPLATCQHVDAAYVLPNEYPVAWANRTCIACSCDPVGQAVSPKCSELWCRQPEQSTELPGAGQSLSRRWPDTGCCQLLFPGKQRALCLML